MRERSRHGLASYAVGALAQTVELAAAGTHQQTINRHLECLTAVLGCTVLVRDYWQNALKSSKPYILRSSITSNIQSVSYINILAF